MSETINEVMVADSMGTDSLANDIQSLKRGEVNVFSSFAASTHGERTEILRVMTNSSPLDEMIGKSLALKHFVIQQIEMPDQDTGELRAVPRVILVDADGKSYHAISSGVFSSLKNFVGILGMPSEWPEPLTVTVIQDKTNKGYRVFTLRIS